MNPSGDTASWQRGEGGGIPSEFKTSEFKKSISPFFALRSEVFRPVKFEDLYEGVVDA